MEQTIHHQQPTTYRQGGAKPSRTVFGRVAAILLPVFSLWFMVSAVNRVPVGNSVPVRNAGTAQKTSSRPVTNPVTNRVETGQTTGNQTTENWWPRKGNYLVALISTECSHCQNSVPGLNAYVTARHLPPLHGLCYNEPWQIAMFQKQWGARFPVHRTTLDVFMQRLGPHHTPCVQWVTDGTVRLTVEPPLPSPAELRQRIQAASQPGAPNRKPAGNARKHP